MAKPVMIRKIHPTRPELNSIWPFFFWKNHTEQIQPNSSCNLIEINLISEKKLIYKLT
jgi:hypothetical protein